jgi:transposase InsO family protein
MKRDRERKQILEEVKRLRYRQPMVGGRKLQRMLQRPIDAEPLCIGRDRLFDILREEDLLVTFKRRRAHTTDSGHGFRTYRNLIKDRVVRYAGEVLVSDITYIDTYDGFCYLSLITDLYSRKIMGHCLSTSLSIEGSMEALKMALNAVQGVKEVIHHSDRGIQYCSKAYVGVLRGRDIRISMTEENHCYENAVAERVNGILKNELMLGEKIISFALAQKLVTEAVKIYNEERLHMSLGYITPAEKYAA